MTSSRMLVAASLLCGCATMSTDRRQPIAVTSRAPGAAIIVDGKELARTPATLVVRTDVPVEIRIIASDGRTHACTPSATPHAGFVAVQALLTPLWAGLVVDAWTGAWNRLPDRCAAPW